MSDETAQVVKFLAESEDWRAKQTEIDAARDRFIELALPGELRGATYWEDLAAGYVSGEPEKLNRNALLTHLLDLNERLKAIEALMPPQECP